MKVVYLKHIDKFDSNLKSIALGFFDGFHIGHINVLNSAITKAKELNLISSLITFNMSFNDYFSSDKTRDLFTIDDKIDYASKLGFDEIVIIELTDEFLSLDKDKFIDIFLKDAAYISCGFDYSFGKNASGNIEDLKRCFNDRLNVIKEVKYNGLKVGTKEIKNNLDEADLEYVKYALNRNYKIHGTIYTKNNKIYLNTENYIPRSGKYVVLFDGVETELKIKYKKDIDSLYLKFMNDIDVNFNIYNHKIEFIKAVK